MKILIKLKLKPLLKKKKFISVASIHEVLVPYSQTDNDSQRIEETFCVDHSNDKIKVQIITLQDTSTSKEEVQITPSYVYDNFEETETTFIGIPISPTESQDRVLHSITFVASYPIHYFSNPCSMYGMLPFDQGTQLPMFMANKGFCIPY